MRELWLIRHGETEWSLSGAHTGRTDIPLTAAGRANAAAVGRYLAGRRFALVLVSPLTRARETCRLAGLESCSVIDSNLREWDYGDYEGLTTAQIQVENPRWSLWANGVPHGETAEQVAARADAVIARALAATGAQDLPADSPAVSHADSPAVSHADSPAESPADQDQDVALFAHGHILRIVAARWLGLPPRDGRLFALGTGAVSTLGYERQTHVITRWNLSFSA